jgi:hypothetical protein
MTRILLVLSVVACFAIVLLVKLQPTGVLTAPPAVAKRDMVDVPTNPLPDDIKMAEENLSAKSRNISPPLASQPPLPEREVLAGTTLAGQQKSIVRVKFSDVAPTSFDTGVVGRTFPISESVRPTCNTEGTMACQLEADLIRFSQEPRDGDWAPVVEERVRSIIESRNPGSEIRSLECRVTLCAMEVASTQGQVSGRRGVGWDEGLAIHILPLVTTTGEETPQKGQFYVTVTLLLYERTQ